VQSLTQHAAKTAWLAGLERRPFAQGRGGERERGGTEDRRGGWSG